MGGEQRNPFSPGVRYLDAQGLGVGGQPDLEVPARFATVDDGVSGELGRDEGQRLVHCGRVGVAPCVELVRDQAAGEAGAARSGAEAHRELGGRGAHFCRVACCGRRHGGG